MTKRKKRIPIWFVVVLAVFMPTILFGSYTVGQAYFERVENEKVATKARVEKEAALKRAENEKKTEAAYRASFSEEKLIDETNAYRATKGLAPLSKSEKLHQSACLKAQDMVDKNYWSHDAPDGTEPWYFFRSVNYEYRKAGENLFYGGNAGSVIGSWVSSPKHDEILRGDFIETGICTVFTKNYQEKKWLTNVTVAHFGTPL